MSSKNITISLTKSEAKALCRTIQFWTNMISPIQEGTKCKKWMEQDLAHIKNTAEKIVIVLPEAAV
jgi:hypothetical protein